MEANEASNSFGDAHSSSLPITPTGVYADDLTAALERSLIGACITNAAGNFELVNEHYCTIHGYKRHELLGQHFSVVATDPSRRDVWQQMHDDFLAHQTDLAGEWVIKSKTGALHTILTDAVRITGTDGRHRKLTYVQDVTQMRQLEITKSQTENRANALFSLPGWPALYADVYTHKIKEANAAWPPALASSTSAGTQLDALLTADQPWSETMRQARLHRTLVMPAHLNDESRTKGNMHLQYLRNAGGEELLVVFVMA